MLYFQRHFWIFTSHTTLPRKDNYTLGGGNWIVLSKLLLTQKSFKVMYCLKWQKYVGVFSKKYTEQTIYEVLHCNWPYTLLKKRYIWNKTKMPRDQKCHLYCHLQQAQDEAVLHTFIGVVWWTSCSADSCVHSNSGTLLE